MPSLDFFLAKGALSKLLLEFRSVHGRHRRSLLYNASFDDLLDEIHHSCDEWGADLHNSARQLPARLRVFQLEIWGIRDIWGLFDRSNKLHHRIFERLRNNQLKLINFKT